MKNLLILRHGKSSWDNAELTDFQRPLNERGLKDTELLGSILSKEGLMPDYIITSNAKRALDTAQRVARFSGFEGQLKSSPSLYEANVNDYINEFRLCPNEYSTVMIVGHNPALETWVQLLTASHETLTTSNLAKIQLPINNWKELTQDTKGQLKALWRPKNIKKDITI